MAKSANHKLKLLYLMKILLEKTDEAHSLSVPQMIEELGRYGISAERKSIYDDLEALKVYGLDIETMRTRTTGYYVANRTFELPELKLLVDSVQASKFITHKKSMELIQKIESFASIYEAQLLRRQVYVANRVKSMNESIYYNVDAIHSAIGENKQIVFRYFEYTVTKQRKFKRDGQCYQISPLALCWADGNYYMVGFDSEAGIVKHYRVDKMLGISHADAVREGLEEFSKLDMAVYSRKIFSMFGGREERVTMQFDKQLVGVVIDRFGRDVMILKSDDTHFAVHADVFVSPQFFGWLCGFGGKAKILAPEDVAAEFRAHVAAVLEE